MAENNKKDKRIMKWINSGRRCGKTYMMIVTSYTTDIPILVSDISRKTCVLQQAKQMGYNDIKVFALHEWRDKYKFGYNYDQVLIDDAERIIEKALENTLGCKVTSITTNIPYIDNNKN